VCAQPQVEATWSRLRLHHLLGGVGLLCLLVAPQGAVEAADLPRLAPGKWRVVERPLNLDCRLRSLEILATRRSGELSVTAWESDDRGDEKAWGSGKLAVDSGGLGALQAEWLSGTARVVLKLRPEPDGRLIALVRIRDRDRPTAVPERVRQVVLAPESGRERLVSDTPTPPRAAGAPATNRADLAALYVCSANGSGSHIVAAPDDFTRAGYPAWSPDGKHIAFTAFDASGRDPLIRVVDPAGGPTTAVAAGVAPTWSRDGTRIAYMASSKPDFATDWASPGRNDERIDALRLIGPGAGEVETLARGVWPRWSPADDRLAFVARFEANWDLYVRTSDGASLVRITDDPALDTFPRWTRDAQGLVFLSTRGNRWDLYRVSSDGRGQAVRLTDHSRREEQPDISPDGSSVVFTDGLGRSDSRLRILDLNSGAVKPLTDSPQGERDPAWSPDGKFIAFVSRRPSPLVPISGRRP
jgi:Tol biopolymer transport system component